jgi:hypothetical protein
MIQTPDRKRYSSAVKVIAATVLAQYRTAEPEEAV